MDFIITLLSGNSVAHTIIVLALTISGGLALGSIRIKGISLGVGGVLFSGLLLGHFHVSIDTETMHFIREFGLILFVYAIGLQVGPGFFASLRKQGFVLNTLALSIVILGSGIAIMIGAFTNIRWEAIIGMLSGGVTNTPSLGAAQQALYDIPSIAGDASQVVGMGYAVAYPFGIIGIIITMLLIRKLFQINLQQEANIFEQNQQVNVTPIHDQSFMLSNEKLGGKTVAQLAKLVGGGVIISRILHDKKQILPTGSTKLSQGDILHAVGSDDDLDKFEIIVGSKTNLNLPVMQSEFVSKRVIVTKEEQVGKTIAELALAAKYSVVITRVIRAGIEFSASGDIRIQFGDRLHIIGMKEALERAASILGDSVKALEKPHIIPIFVGIGLGILLGSVPFTFSFIPAPVKLGLAGGPLLVAIVMGRIGKIGPLISYMSNSSKELLKEFGIALFLACVGLASGERFLDSLINQGGFYWMLMATLITCVPLIVVACIARMYFKLNYISILGLLSGSMTDPPALAYATQLAQNDAPSVSYATVYPLTMLMRVIIAQVLVLLTLGS